MVRLWYGKLKLSKPYLGFATQSISRWFSSRPALSHPHHPHHHHHSLANNGRTKINTWLERDVTGRTLTQNPIAGQHRTVSTSSVAQDITIETFDSVCNQGNSREAVEVLDYLENDGYAMDLSRLLKLAKLCGSKPEALEEAKVVHECIVALVSPSDVSSLNAIIEMYSGCGSVDDALRVFHEMPEKDSETWCVMLRCFVKNGYGEEAIDLFTRFKEEGNKPDGEMFKEVFAACALTGDVNEGSLHFEAMHRYYGIVPSMGHYHSVTKMLAKSGHLDEAMNFVERMPMEPSVDVWETLMYLSWVHGDLELGDGCAELVKKLDATRLDKVSSAGLVATKASDSVKEEEPNYQSKSYPVFRRGDTEHPEMDTIYETLESLKSQMLEMGYVADTRVYYTGGLEKEDKEERILGHTDKLAVVHGLLSSSPRSPVLVMSDFRICQDCHNALKLISEITGRELKKRDEQRFHFFKNGVCSCNDCW